MSTDRRSFKREEKEYAWEKAAVIPGKNPDVYRQDKSGNQIYKSSYGKNTAQGWDVDHSKPLSKGGTYHKNNLHALQSAQNRWDKSGNYPYNWSSPTRGVTQRDLMAYPVDRRSKSVRSNDVRFTSTGSVDKRSKSVRSGELLLTKSGQPDKRSRAFKNGSIL